MVTAVRLGLEHDRLTEAAVLRAGQTEINRQHGGRQQPICHALSVVKVVHSSFFHLGGASLTSAHFPSGFWQNFMKEVASTVPAWLKIFTSRQVIPCSVVVEIGV